MRTELIVFDLGGVLASLGHPAEQMQLGMSEDEFWSVWLASATVATLETGGMAEHEFFARFPAELGLPDSGRDFRRRFQRWRLELFPGVTEWLRQLGERYRIALLSNTNPIHWQMVDPDGGFRPLFDHVFLSYEIGRAKPAPAIFEHVLECVPHDPGAIVFLDDTASNVAAAATHGIRSVQVTGPGGARHALGLQE